MSFGFRDWIHAPGWRRWAGQLFAVRREAADVRALTDEQIADCVERLFDPVDAPAALRTLDRAGAAAVSALLRALADPRCGSAFGETQHCTDPQSPLEAIWELLRPCAPTEAIPSLISLAAEDSEVQTDAVEALGAIGSSACIPSVQAALKADDDYVRSSAMLGIEQGIAAGRCEGEFLEAMFPCLVDLLDREDESVSGTAPELLLRIDSGRAIPILLSPQFFHSGNPEVVYILRAMTAARHSVPAEILRPLMADCQPTADGTSRNLRAYAEGLIALSASADASDRNLIREGLRSPLRPVRRAAADALMRSAGIAGAREFLQKRIDRSGFSALTTPQRHYYAVSAYDSEVRNGGHEQYFLNSSGKHWRTAIEGLAAVGAPGRAELLRAAVAAFGPEGPSEDNDRRSRQLSRLLRRDDSALRAVDSRYDSCQEDLNVLLAGYASEHREQFAGDV